MVKGGNTVRIVVVKAPKSLAGLLRKLFKIEMEKKE